MTSLIQPMDQSVIATFKKHYRQILLQDYLANYTENIQKFLKTMTIKMAIDIMALAWDAVKESTLKGSFSKLLRGRSRLISKQRMSFWGTNFRRRRILGGLRLISTKTRLMKNSLPNRFRTSLLSTVPKWKRRWILYMERTMKMRKWRRCHTGVEWSSCPSLSCILNNKQPRRSTTFFG